MQNVQNMLPSPVDSYPTGGEDKGKIYFLGETHRAWMDAGSVSGGNPDAEWTKARSLDDESMGKRADKATSRGDRYSRIVSSLAAKLSSSTLIKPAIALTATAAAVLISTDAFAGGGNPIIDFLNECVTAGSLAGTGIGTIGLMTACGSAGLGQGHFVGQGLKAGGGGAGMLGASQLFGLAVPGSAAGASLDLAAHPSLSDWVGIIVSAFS